VRGRSWRREQQSAQWRRPRPSTPTTRPCSSCTDGASGNQALAMEVSPHTRQSSTPQHAAEPWAAVSSGEAAARRLLTSLAAAACGGSGATRLLGHGDWPCSGAATATGSTVACQHTRRRGRPSRGVPPSSRSRLLPPQDAGSGGADAPAPSAALFCGAAAHDRSLPPLEAL